MENLTLFKTDVMTYNTGMAAGEKKTQWYDFDAEIVGVV